MFRLTNRVFSQYIKSTVIKSVLLSSTKKFNDRSPDLACSPEIQLLTLNHEWSDICKVVNESLEIVEKNFDNKLANRARNLLHWAKELAVAYDLSSALIEMRKQDNSRSHYPFFGPLSSSMFNWADAVKELNKEKILEKVDLSDPKKVTDVAVYNLFVMVRKILADVFNNKADANRLAWPIVNEKILLLNQMYQDKDISTVKNKM